MPDPADPATAPSGYVDVDAAPDPGTYVRRLDTSGASDFHRALARRSIELLAPQPGQHLLEVGCGTGSHVLELASLVGADGSVTGLDRSRTMIEECVRRHSGRPTLRARFILGEAWPLPLADDEMDGCRTMRTLLHIDEAPVVVAEMARVTRPGGCVVLVEPDYGAAEIVGSDAELTRRLVAARVAHFAQGRAGLWLRPWAVKAGLRVSVSEVRASMARQWSASVEQRYRRKYVEPALALGSVRADEGEQWLADLRQAAAEGRYSHRRLVTVVAADKPLV